MKTLKFLCTVAVWGEEYTRLFVELALPSLLADGNLPAIAAQSRFQIYSSEPDIHWMQQCASIQKLKALMPVEFHLVTNFEGKYYPYTIMTECHRRAIYHADIADEVLVSLSPDCILSHGSLAFASHKMHGVASVISLAGLRLASEMVIPLLHQYVKEAKLSISSKELMHLALNNLHPLTLKQVWNDKKYGSVVPGNILWKMDEGILARCFFQHPIMVHAEKKHAVCNVSIDQDYVAHACPDTSRHIIIQNSDDMTMFELSPLSRYMDEVSTEDNEILMERVCGFLKNYTDHVHIENVKREIYLHTGNMESAAWKKAKLESDSLLDELFSSMGVSHKSTEDLPKKELEIE